MSQIKAVKALAKMLAYTLGVDPYEFGLIPDAQGYVKIKELLKAMDEEEGWGHTREAHIKEVCLTISPCPIEMDGKKVRAVDRTRLALPRYGAEVPKELYAAIRQRAWPRVHDRGLDAPEDALIRLTTERAFATRLGKRIDGHPVILTIHTALAEEMGIVFQRAADHLYLAQELPPQTIHGPALPKPGDPKKKPAKKKPKIIPLPETLAIHIDEDSFTPHPKSLKGKKDKTSWKENKKRFRKDRDHVTDLE